MGQDVGALGRQRRRLLEVLQGLLLAAALGVGAAQQVEHLGIGGT